VSAAAPARKLREVGRGSPRVAPGLDALIHPLPLAALAVLLVNDHLLKPNVPSLLTGKLSGIAVLVLLPFVLLAAWEVARFIRPSFAAIGRRLVIGSVVVTVLSYVGIEIVPFAADVYRVGLGAAQWPVRALASALAGEAMPALAPVLLTSDVTDLFVTPIALGVLVIGPWSLRKVSEGTG
jgi:hypothetical protein